MSGQHPIDITIRAGGVWSNLTVAETIVELRHVADRLASNREQFRPAQRGKEKIG